MEKVDHQLIETLASSNPELKELYDEHIRLDQEVERCERYANYSATAAMEQKRLKKEKLLGMDQINAILEGFRH